MIAVVALVACVRTQVGDSVDTAEPRISFTHTYDECDGLGAVVDGTRETWLGSGDGRRRGDVVVMRSEEDVHSYTDGTDIDYGDVIGDGVDFSTEQVVAYDWRNEGKVRGRWIKEFRWVDTGAAMTAVIEVDVPCEHAEDVFDEVQVWVTPIIDVRDSCLEGSECVAN